MTAREHFVAAARGEQTHRPPVGAWVHFGTALAAPEQTACAHLDFLDAYGWDYLKVMHDYRLPALGPDQGPLRDRVEAFGAAGDEAASLDRQRTVLRLIREANAEVALVETIFSPLQTVIRSLGADVVALFQQDGDLAHRVLGRVSQLLAGYVAELPALQVDGLFMAVTGASADWTSFGITDEQFRSWVAPHDQTVLAAATPLVRIAHLHGDSLRLDLISEHDYEVASWSDLVSGPTIAQVLGQGRLPMLGMDERASSYWSTQQVHDQVLRARREAGDRLIVAPNCTLHSDTNPEVFRALRSAVELPL